MLLDAKNEKEIVFFIGDNKHYLDFKTFTENNFHLNTIVIQLPSLLELSENLIKFKRPALVVLSLNLPADCNVHNFTDLIHEKSPLTRSLQLNFSSTETKNNSLNFYQNQVLVAEKIKDSLHIFKLLTENSLLKKTSITDALTGAFNHRYFWKRLEAEISRSSRTTKPLSLLIVDIDNFKVFNDTYGHLKGDATLKNVVKCLSENKRNMDTVARYGGEEFAIILPETTPQQGFTVAERIRKSTAKEHKIMISGGIACYPLHANTPTKLVYFADQALLRAKEKGKNQIILSS